jgi:Domain of unknown function (DUF4872)/Butirosin biosynthesis protein H, N-terminal
MSGATAAPAAAFPHRRGQHCGSSALTTLLDHRELGWEGGALTEADVFGIGGGLALIHCELDVLGLPVYVLGRSETLELDFCAHIGADVDVRTTDEPELGARWLREEVEAGRPTMVYADIKHLDYLDVKMQNARHAIVVTGWDEDDGRAVVSDFDRDELEACSLASLAAARASTGFPRPAGHATWVIDYPDRLPPVHDLVTSGLRRAAANMRGHGRAGDGELLGLPGLDRFAAEFATWRDLPEEHLQALLYRVWFCVAIAGTGGALFRSLQAEFLDHAAALLRDDVLGRAAVLFHELADAWRALADSARGTTPAESHRRGRFALARVQALEVEGVELIESWLEGET